jgi:hypothetical protein
LVEKPGVVVAPLDAIPDAERSRFDWRELNAAETSEEALAAPFKAARAYLADALLNT